MRASRVRWTLLVSVAAALLLAVTACGGSKKSSSSASSQTTPTTTTTTTSTDTGSTSDGTSTTVTATTSSDDSSSTGSVSTGSGTVAKKCIDYAGAAGKLGQALAASGGQSLDSEGLKNYFAGLAKNAPSDIKAAFQTLAKAIGTYVDGIKGLNLKAGQTPSAADLAKVQAAVASLSKPDIQAASNKIQAWVNAGCHS
jgi:hypothetical protein